MSSNTTVLVQQKLIASLTGSAKVAIKHFADAIPELPEQAYSDAILGMGYQYESFDMLFTLIAYHIQATHNISDYDARSRCMQNLLQPLCSEYGIEPERPLGSTHRSLYRDFYESVTGQLWPSTYPRNSASSWINTGRYWANRMIENLECHGMDIMDRAKYNLGYHWAAEYLSIIEFGYLRQGWSKMGITPPYLQIHCNVEPEHSACAAHAIVEFTSLNDPLVIRGIRDHEYDLCGFYNENFELIQTEKNLSSTDHCYALLKAS
ncbi:MAG: hypothetical protein F6K19_19400 [Cyanothece sp. SIO1E1]|nr:hypothetical protein [Cyanothece sp. SIO1E1]